MPPKPLALPPKLLKEIGAPDQPSASRSRGRWKSQEQNRKDRRRAERQSKKQRFATTRKGVHPEIHRGTSEDEGEHEHEREHDILDDVDVAHEPSAPHESANSVLKKRKRACSQDEEDEEGEANEDKSKIPPMTKVPSRAVRERLAKDDAEIEQLERKLGLKKGRKSLPTAFKDDGLDDLLGGLGDGSDSDTGISRQSNEAKEWFAQKRRKANSAHAGSDDAMDHEDNGLVSVKHHRIEPDDDDIEDGDDAWDQVTDETNSDARDDVAPSGHDSFLGFDSVAEETTQSTKRTRENPYLPPVATGTQSSKYIPPSLRAKSSGDADLEAHIRRKLQGPVNRVTEANMISVVGEIEKVYRDHPRGHIHTILTGLLMAQVCDATSKPDTLLVLSAGFIAAIYKVIGVDFAAYFMTAAVERFHNEREKAVITAREQQIPTKETSNLITVLAEMYIFRIVGSNLMFDLVRLLLGDISELSAELLLRIVRVAGPQLRKDDPLALKDIVSLIRPAVAKIGDSNLTVRTKFMIETISDLKNNKLKAGAQDLVILNEHVTRMKKLLGSLDTQKLRATEPLRIGLGDIENAEKTGKWWLVGASWAGSGAHGTKQAGAQVPTATSGTDKSAVGDHEDDDDGVLVADADDLVTPDYGQLAREQGMNTDVRRAIFIALVAAADYHDAYMRILKLRLNKYNRREVPNVLIQCSGAQQHYNPYYTLVAKKFCSDSRIKYAFQDTIWTLFRRLGEPLFGEEPEEEDEQAADDRRLINTAKMVGGLVAGGSLGLGILKPLNLAYIKETTALFVEVMLITVLQECSRAKHRTMEQALGAAFGSGLTPELARSVGYFLRKRVRDTDLIDSKKDAKKVRQACKVAEVLLEKPTVGDDM